MSLFKGYRTVTFNLVTAIVPVMELANMTYAIPHNWMPYWIFAFILGNVILRYMTTTPIGSK